MALGVVGPIPAPAFLPALQSGELSCGGWAGEPLPGPDWPAVAKASSICTMSSYRMPGQEETDGMPS